MLKYETKNYTIEINPATHYGYFEHNELGEERGGGLWFDEQTGDLTDYDGVCQLPKQVKELLNSIGLIADEDMENF